MSCLPSPQFESNIVWHLGNYFYLLYYSILTVLCSLLGLVKFQKNLKMIFMAKKRSPWKYFDLYWSSVNDRVFMQIVNLLMENIKAKFLDDYFYIYLFYTKIIWKSWLGGKNILISFWIKPSEIHIDNWNPLSERKWKHLLSSKWEAFATETVLFTQVYFNFSETSIWRFISTEILFRLCLPKSEVAGTFSIPKK